MKIKFFCTLLLVSGIALFSQAQNSTNGGVFDVPKINVVGVGSVSVFPNAASISIDVRFVKPTLREAVNENQKTTQQIVAILKKYVKDTTEIKISLISTDKTTRYDNSLKKYVFAGFESNQKIIFTLYDLNEMQNCTEDLLKTKMQEIEEVSYFHTNASDYLRQAQEFAIADANEISERLAKAAQKKVVKILYIQTNSSPTNASNTTVNSYSFRTYSKGMGGEGVRSSGELLNYTAQVTVISEIQ